MGTKDSTLEEGGPLFVELPSQADAIIFGCFKEKT